MSVLRALIVLLALGVPSLSLAQASKFHEVALADLLANPQAYQDQNVRVHGFLVLEFEGNTLWLTERDFRANRYEKAVWLKADTGLDSSHPLSGKRVFISGRFDTTQGGHLGLTNSVIDDVSQITPDTTDLDQARPWRDDPMFILLACLGMLGLFIAVTTFGLRGLRTRAS